MEEQRIKNNFNPRNITVMQMRKTKDTGKELNICASNRRMIAKNNEQRLKSVHLMKNK
jgi:hypothetical protein